MKQIISILLFAIFVVGYSCEKKQTKTDQEVVQSEINETEPDKATAPIDTNLDPSFMTQKEIFDVLVDAMALNDMDSYNKFIPRLNNIDTLVLMSPNGDEDEVYYSLLALSCRFNSLEPMKDLVLRGANIALGSEDEFYAQDALYHAILGGNAEMVKILIDKKTNVNVLYTSTGITPLVLAVTNKKLFMAELLLQAGANVNGAGKLDIDYILYPLHEAIRQNDVEMVKLLLQHKANKTLKDVEGQNALALAEGLKAKEIIPLLKK